MSVARKEATAQIVEKYQLFDGDTGSCPVQIALLSHRIRHLTEHLKEHQKDFHTTHGLRKLVSQRRKLMKYYKAHSPKEYLELLQKLQLRDIRAL
jgi:small subunit ribosomal protein S15